MSAIKISKVSLESCIEEHFHTALNRNQFDLKEVDAIELLTANRFDLAFKLLYLDKHIHSSDFLTNAYDEHIRAFSLGAFTEPGNEDKDSIDKFHASFDSTYENIKMNGFDPTKTLVPLSNNGSIANGAHRVASAINLGKKISCVKIDTKDQIYDYKFFYSRNVSVDILDAAATKFIELSNHVYIACVWPTATGKDTELEAIFPNIIYRKDIKLTPNGAHNLLSQVYAGEKWLGSIDNNYKGVSGKLVECFKKYGDVRFIAFQGKSLDDVLIIKEKVRKLFNVGKHSIHITDTKPEALELSRLVFNDNAVHFLNYAKPNKYIDTHRKLSDFKDFLVLNSLQPEEVVLDSGIILAIYGLRKASDLDFISFKGGELDFINTDIESHDTELIYHKLNKGELLFSPRNYFYFQGIKFISFNQLYLMKECRLEEKDKNDIAMMKNMIEDNRFRELYFRLKQSILYGKVKAFNQSLLLLRKIGIYEIIRSIYRKFK
ncbi:hypothetical protein [Psychromonas antarctica]|uniref:hypothetical protein n=1 Tax=Psychromonas antarctica TaxID=67573 RepID=UPI001EE85323|nr:hypothetical protein [Psychromonas antarctica]MCG6202761.1 hypothetical protein [Psychromonas antarctica]